MAMGHASWRPQGTQSGELPAPQAGSLPPGQGAVWPLRLDKFPGRIFGRSGGDYLSPRQGALSRGQVVPPPGSLRSDRHAYHDRY
jgi:hypothetical protein